jgi:flagellar motor switch protein FliN/FliY
MADEEVSGGEEKVAEDVSALGSEEGASSGGSPERVSLGEFSEDSSEDDPMQAAFDPRLVDMVTPAGARDLEAVYSVPVIVTAVLGKARIQVSDLLKMKRGVVVELDRKIGEPIDIFVNGRLVARGEVVVVKERLGITMTEIIKSESF